MVEQSIERICQQTKKNVSSCKARTRSKLTEPKKHFLKSCHSKSAEKHEGDRKRNEEDLNQQEPARIAPKRISRKRIAWKSRNRFTARRTYSQPKIVNQKMAQMHAILNFNSLSTAINFSSRLVCAHVLVTHTHGRTPSWWSHPLATRSVCVKQFEFRTSKREETLSECLLDSV